MRREDQENTPQSLENDKGINDGNPSLIPLFLFWNLLFQANAEVSAISNPAAKITTPNPAPPAVARIGVIPNKRNPNANRPSLESMIFSLVFDSFNTYG